MRQIGWFLFSNEEALLGEVTEIKESHRHFGSKGTPQQPTVPTVPMFQRTYFQFPDR